LINGAHFLIYSRDPEADRAFLRDVLQFRSVDVGHGWLIFKLPPSEIAVHPSDGEFVQKHAEHDLLGIVLYLMCDDIVATVKGLEEKKVACTKPDLAPWGTYALVTMPSGGKIGLYQPSHPTAIALAD
jgi:hypothetical protein